MTFRSLDMSHHNICIPRDIVYEAINRIGYQNILHFIDESGQVNKPFSQSLKRCEESLVKIDIICNALKKQDISLIEYEYNEHILIEKLKEFWINEAKQLQIEQQKLIDVYEQRVMDEFERFQEISMRTVKYFENHQDVLEKIACLQVLNKFCDKYKVADNRLEESEFSFSFLLGIISHDVQLKIQRIIYRLSRGSVIIQIKDTFEFEGLKQFKKKVIIVTYPTSHVLKIKIEKVMETYCRSFIRGNQLQSPTKQQYQKLTQQYSTIYNIVEMGKKQKKQFMMKMRQMGNIQTWRIFFWKEKALYECMNKLKLYKQFYVANVFMPNRDLWKITQIINEISPSPTIIMGDDGQTQPTAFDTTCYTETAQQITNTYGIPRYKQINPSLFTVITFPFFFGVMFGDIAHGAFLFVFGIYLIFNRLNVEKGPLKIFSSLRYMITLMGFFAVYCGFIYNDFAGFNMNFFSSCFNPHYPLPDGETDTELIPIHSSKDCVYSFGIDPIWGRATNELVFVNSLKMKISVIIAIIHMTFGICIKAANTLYFKKKLQFIFEFIPQLIFLVLFFGYMDFLIIFKWLKFWNESTKGIPPEQWAPSIIETMMNIGLKLGKTSTQPDGTSNMWGTRGNSSQDILQIVILLISVLCLPIMLIPKPFIQIRRINKRKKDNFVHQMIEQAQNQEQQLPQEAQPHTLTQKLLKQHSKMIKSQSKMIEKQNKSHEQQLREQDTSQIIVHQLIETIQFGLGAISNTASYLRLWALSLAHSQLTRVFFNQTAGRIIGDKGVFFIQALAILLTSWIVIWITFAIIICMDSMECFLHSLRLHWVQFQNKFYKGDGYRYQPFSFSKAIMDKKKTETF